jgi:hypothetical protein
MTKDSWGSRIEIDIYKDYVMIGTQRVNRAPDEPPGDWLNEWEKLKAGYNDRRRNR